MKKAYVLLNHELTLKQVEELKQKFLVDKIVYPPKEITVSWLQINPEGENCRIIKNVILWLKNTNKNDVLIVQGEFGSTFMIVDFALKNNLIPLYATTKRIAKENIEGEIVHREYIFEHVCFKEYKYFGE
jgi:hypothetical protein